VSEPERVRSLTPKGLATRARIVAAAAELVARHGVAGTSNEQVRRAAGVSGSQLSHYFDSKQALIQAVITQQADAAGYGDSPQLGALDSFEALDAWAEAAVTRQLENGCRGDCSLANLAGELGPGDDASRAALSDGFLRWRDVLRNGIAAMQDRGELRPDADPEAMAYALLVALQGGSLLSQTLRDITPMRSGLTAALAYVRAFAAEATPPGP
jgi:TetR/AcrR family transcriptional regulator, transcriptional repressor for nem operon